MKVITCDRCGVLGRSSKHDDGPRVVEVKAGLHNGGRILDLCGDCRKEFSTLVDEWVNHRAATETAGGERE